MPNDPENQIEATDATDTVTVLRDYQAEAVNDLAYYLLVERRPTVGLVMPTGSGKTTTMIALLHAVQPHLRGVLVAERFGPAGEAAHRFARGEHAPALP